VNSIDKLFIVSCRFSRGRRVVENGFGILTSSYQVFRGPILQSYENAVKTVQAAVCLHNFCMVEESATAAASATTREARLTESGLPSARDEGRGRRGSHQAHLQRDALAEYFMNEGQVAFQWEKTFATSRRSE
jgi:hypothetical protein